MDRSVVAALLSGALLMAAPGVAAAEPLTLEAAFEAAWARQPEGRSQAARKAAAEAQLTASQGWTPEPAAVSLSAKSDQFNRNEGSDELEAGLAIPLWLPGERARAQTLARAQVNAVQSRTGAARLQLAATVRSAWWQWHRAELEHGLALQRLENARRLASDVERRVKGGELAKVDLQQAAGAVAGAEAALAEANASLATASGELNALTGVRIEHGSNRTLAEALVFESTPGLAEPMTDRAPTPALIATPNDGVSIALADHPVINALLDRSRLARAGEDLALAQSRASPELELLTTRERGAGEGYRQNFTVGIRIPLSSDSRHRARIAQAQAESIEADSQLRIEQVKLRAEREAARERLDAARSRLDAASRRAALARDSRALFVKSFNRGETDLPTRLRIEFDALEAERESNAARIDVAASISALRQALGLLPQ